MPWFHTCTNGHDWWASKKEATCPTCGALEVDAPRRTRARVTRLDEHGNPTGPSIEAVVHMGPAALEPPIATRPQDWKRPTRDLLWPDGR